jgi:hypothetical protein
MLAFAGVLSAIAPTETQPEVTRLRHQRRACEVTLNTEFRLLPLDSTSCPDTKLAIPSSPLLYHFRLSTHLWGVYRTISPAPSFGQAHNVRGVGRHCPPSPHFSRIYSRA